VDYAIPYRGLSIYHRGLASGVGSFLGLSGYHRGLASGVGYFLGLSGYPRGLASGVGSFLGLSLPQRSCLWGSVLLGGSLGFTPEVLPMGLVGVETKNHPRRGGFLNTF